MMQHQTQRCHRCLRAWLLLLCLGSSLICVAQQLEPSYSYKDGNVIVSFDNVQDKNLLNRLLATIGSSLAMTDSLYQLKDNRLSPLGWELIQYDDLTIAYQKSLRKLSKGKKKDFYFNGSTDGDAKKPYELDVPYGINVFKRSSVVMDGSGAYVFRLFDLPKARNVYLSGTFNNWSTLAMPLRKDGDAWTLKVPLDGGKHLYKFIVDGHWMLDPSNALREMDHYGNTNSVLYVYNYVFALDGHPNARDVYVAGSFNDWKPDELRMQRERDEWVLPLFLREGTHTYKFVVDGEWVLDPSNPDVRVDEKGYENSFLSFGPEYLFVLEGFSEAKEVFLSGTFNAWNRQQLRMRWEDGAWSLPVALRPGNYEYKFIVDGNWRLDPSNEHQTGSGDLVNSVLAIEANHSFFLEGHPDAKEVLLSGTFNDWSFDGYSMEKVEGGWQIELYLPEGKTRYKFIVDGQWVMDEQNPYWEYNQFNTKNSVLWIE
ncbi:MAG: glycogen-binding domain-containing protein [Bacteroidota bacterium]